MADNLAVEWHELADGGWERVAPRATDLLHCELSAGSVDAWLAGWAAVARLMAETYNRLYIRTTTHTDDAQGQARFRKYSEEVMPRTREFEQGMKQKLLASGLRPAGMSVPLRRMQAEAAIFRTENLPLRTACERLQTEYETLMGERSFDWDGETLNQSQVAAKLTDPDRRIRERAWMALDDGLARQQAAMDRVWVELLDLRLRMARNAGFEDYRSCRWQELGRFDYTPHHCKAFHDAILQVAVPAVRRRRERRRQAMSLDHLRVWDDHWFWRPDALGRLPLRPFQSVEELSAGVGRAFAALDPVLASYYHTLAAEGLLDLEARSHKATSGYMTELPASKRAFIFTTAVGTHDDVLTLLHESGHAFHMFEAAHWPHHYQSMLEYGHTEFGELASGAMVLLAQPYLSRDCGGFYTPDELARAMVEDLESTLGFWPYMAVVDAFQHWVYEHPAAARDTRQCDDVWATLHRRFLPHLDWSGVEDTLRRCWRMQLYIFLYPFYYIEYGMSGLGALGVWANALQDRAAAVKAYRSALALGNTVSLPELYQAAGVRFEFGVPELQRAVDLLESKIAELE